MTAQTVAGTPGASATTTSTGVYSITGIAADSYTVWFDNCATSGDYVSQYYNGTASGTVFYAGATAIAVATGATVTSINASMALGGSITGTVTDASTGSPLAGICVTATSSAGYVVGSAPSASNGDYVVSGLPSDTYTVQFYGCSTSANDVTQYYNATSSGAASLGGATPVAVAAGSTTSGINAAMAVGGSITGTVSDSTGALIAGICVYASSGGALAGSAMTSATGTYALAGLASGNYVVWFANCAGSSSTYVTQYYDATSTGTTSYAGATPVAVAAGSTTSGINAAMAVGGSITGTVSDSSGAAIAGLCVNASSTIGGFGASAVTATNGTYSISGLASGPYVVQFNNCTSATDYALEYYNATSTGTPSYASATAVAVSAGSTITAIDAQMVPGGSITGTVSDSSGTAIAGICVNASSSDGSTSGAAQTAANGTYTISGLAQASYTVQFTDCGSTGSYATQYYTGTPGGTGSYWSAVAVSVTAGAATSSIDAVMGPGGSIAGTVTDSSGTGIAGVCVYAYATAGGFGGSAETSSSGSYTIEGLATGSYTVGFSGCAGASAYATAYYSTGGATSSYFGASAVPVTAGSTVSGISAQLSVAGTISGTVTDTSGNPIAGICANAWSVQGPFMGSSPTSTTGTYTISGLATGSYYVGFSSCTNSSDYVTQYYDSTPNGATAYAAATAVSVTAGSNTPNVNAQMTVGGSISGTITDASGNPVAGICAMAVTGGFGMGSPPSGVDGTYELNGLASGPYTVEFFGCGATTSYASQFYTGSAGGSASASNALVVTVTAGVLTTGINAVMAAGGSISGAVTDASGAPLAGICVYAYTTSNTFGGFQTSAADGTYVISGLAAGSYDVQFKDCNNIGSYALQYYNATAAGSTSSSGATAVTVSAATTASGINAVMAAGGSISGAVTDASGAPLANICVYVFTGAGAFGGYATSATNGTYVISGLAAGSYDVQFTDCGSTSADYVTQYYNATSAGSLTQSGATAIAVSAGTIASGINAVMAAGGAITGSVTDASGGALVGICITALMPGGSFSAGATSIANGTYVISGLAAGSYDVQFTNCGNAALNYVSQFYNASSAGSLTQTGATVVAVGVGAPASGINAVMAAGGSISGAVTDASGAPLANICVNALATNGDFGYATSATNGTYVISGLAAGSYDVQFSDCNNAALNYVSQYYNTTSAGSLTQSGATAVAVSAATTASGINAVMAAGGSISGAVTDASGAPLANMCVYAFSTAGGFGYTTSATNGTYVISGLAADSYDVQFTDCGSTSADYVSQYYNATSAGSPTQSGATAVAVSAGTTASGINATLAPGGAISGTVTDASGAPLANICVYAFTSAGNFAGNSTSAADGSYTISGLAAGNVVVQFTNCGNAALNYADQFYLAQSSFGTANPVTVVVGQTTPSIDASLLTSQTITFTSTAPVLPAINSTYTPTATATSGLAVSFTVDASSTLGACSISAGVVTFLAAGTCIVDANQVGNSTYAPAPQVQQSIDPPAIAPALRWTTIGEPGARDGAVRVPTTFGVRRAHSLQTQVITLTSSSPTNAAVGGTYTPTATATSGLAVSFTVDASSTSGACTIAGGVVSFVAVGTCIVDADQSGNTTYGPATTVQQTISIAKGTQSISFVSPIPSNATVGASLYAPTATATSGLPVQFSIDASSTSGACAISAGIVSFTGVGSCIVDATQLGNVNYDAAIEQQQLVPVGRGVQTITIASTAPTGVILGAAPYEVVATATSKLPVSVSLDPTSTPLACTISGTTVAFTGIGTCVVDANQPGNADYGPAPQVQQVITVNVVVLGSSPPSPPSPPSLATQAPPPSVAGLSAANVGAPTTEVFGGVAPLSIGVTTSAGVTATLAVPVGALPNNTVMSVYPITGAQLAPTLPTGDQYVTAFAVSWIAPDGTSPGAQPPVTLTMRGASITTGDVVYVVTSAGAALGATATSSGSVTVTFTGNSVLVLGSAPLAQSSLVITATKGIVQRPLRLHATGGSGTGALSFALVSAGSAHCVLSGDQLVAHHAGTCSVTASKSSSAGYLAGTAATTIIQFAGAPEPRVERIVEEAVGRKVAIIRVFGMYFYGQPRVIGGPPNMRVSVMSDRGIVLVLRVSTAATARPGTVRVTLLFAHGQRVSIPIRVV